METLRKASQARNAQGKSQDAYNVVVPDILWIVRNGIEVTQPRRPHHRGSTRRGARADTWVALCTYTSHCTSHLFAPSTLLAHIMLPVDRPVGVGGHAWLTHCVDGVSVVAHRIAHCPTCRCGCMQQGAGGCRHTFACTAWSVWACAGHTSRYTPPIVR